MRLSMKGILITRSKGVSYRSVSIIVAARTVLGLAANRNEVVPHSLENAPPSSVASPDKRGRMDKRYQVFVSSTYADLREERQRVIKL